MYIYAYARAYDFRNTDISQRSPSAPALSSMPRARRARIMPCSTPSSRRRLAIVGQLPRYGVLHKEGETARQTADWKAGHKAECKELRSGK